MRRLKTGVEFGGAGRAPSPDQHKETEQRRHILNQEGILCALRISAPFRAERRNGDTLFFRRIAQVLPPPAKINIEEFCGKWERDAQAERTLNDDAHAV